MDYCDNIGHFGQQWWGILPYSALPTFPSCVAEAEGMPR